MVKQLFVETKGQGLYEITAQVRRLVEIDEGLCTERWLNRLWEHRRRGSRREIVVHVGA